MINMRHVWQYGILVDIVLIFLDPNEQASKEGSNEGKNGAKNKGENKNLETKDELKDSEGKFGGKRIWLNRSRTAWFIYYL